ncbi:MAG: IS1595 family transposase [Candidatus Thiodiazotropha sp. (ex Rostrolucina anterorostrata)]|nr:IS1595 family transposase [Candidatus Thiodiazotropha sp. (ex Rostrolucina anterorostrata)]
MSKNQVQFQKGISLTTFLKEYGTEEQCHSALYQWRWPNGFVCPECGHTECCEITSRQLSQCSRCHRQTSVISGTIFEATKLPLTTWFLGIYLLTQTKSGVSALGLRRQLGITYNATWRMKHKLMQVMKERDESQPVKGIIQMDDAYWGGEHRGGKRGRGAPGKSPFVAAVATNEEGHPIAMRLTKVKGFGNYSGTRIHERRQLSLK